MEESPKGSSSEAGEMLDGLDDVGLEDHLVMIGGEFFGDDASVVRLR